jgi:hypothetical protein
VLIGLVEPYASWHFLGIKGVAAIRNPHKLG